eukprot:CAMPEP_0167791098 /NCGR_PEP_ID=MMETSP0111_2-20121227/11721_1 /TAXON_ID=91324 /ORGANISM="Lotharella globosa, Strain CCCM811" /LENGTH=172 /DNA_ID=CAMNT_0007683677 /DNA_START=195 /DNA_END=714 /DNA_ORIENTATION=+
MPSASLPGTWATPRVAGVVLDLVVGLCLHARKHDAEEDIRDVLHHVCDFRVTEDSGTDGKALHDVRAADDVLVARVRLDRECVHDVDTVGRRSKTDAAADLTAQARNFGQFHGAARAHSQAANVWAVCNDFISVHVGHARSAEARETAVRWVVARGLKHGGVPLIGIGFALF